VKNIRDMDAPVEQPPEVRTTDAGDAVAAKPRLARLSVNITPATQAALDRLVEREGVTVTEALRRLVGYGTLVYETTQVNGDDILIRRGETIERVVLI
jgi:hypothetical protein